MFKQFFNFEVRFWLRSWMLWVFFLIVALMFFGAASSDQITVGSSLFSVGYPGETAMAATKLALSGTLEECPDVKIVWSHLGGGLPMILDRIDRGYQRYSNCPHPPSYYLRRCYFDTACTHGPALECARATWGVDTLVFGTDVPHVPNAEKDTVAALQARSWSNAELDGIFGGTVRRLLA